MAFHELVPVSLPSIFLEIGYSAGHFFILENLIEKDQGMGIDRFQLGFKPIQSSAVSHPVEIPASAEDFVKRLGAIVCYLISWKYFSTFDDEHLLEERIFCSNRLWIDLRT